MKRFCFMAMVVVGCLTAAVTGFADRSTPLIIDHTSTDLTAIPDQWLDVAKTNLHIAYEHTSHGTQLPSGMEAIYDLVGNNYAYGSAPDDNAVLDFHDNAMDGYIYQGSTYAASDLGYDSAGVANWWTATRVYLDNPDNYDVNVIMWSWCNISPHDVNLYINQMESLIAEYGEGGTNPRAGDHPVEFVFMTGHANGGGEDDSSDSRNKIIRQHCIEHNRILFDFSDIENYDPDGKYYLDKQVDDALYYYDINGVRQNWASQYLDEHDGSLLDQLTQECSSCAHSPEGGETADAKLNCVLKGSAVWHLAARLAGWGDCLPPPTALSAPDGPANETIVLTWQHTTDSMNADGFIIQRQVNNGAWDNDFAQVAANVLTFTDTVAADDSYRYRIVAFLNDDGEGNPCYSRTSNTITVADDPDSDQDGTPDSLDACPADPLKIAPGLCDCGTPDTDTDNDGTPDCLDNCPADPDKTEPGNCGCGAPETCNEAPLTPTPVSPAYQALEVTLTPTLTAGPFSDADTADHHAGTRWQISSTEDFAAPLVDTLSTSQLTSYAVAAALTPATTYYWRVRYIDNRDGESAWSQIFVFTTREATATAQDSTNPTTAQGQSSDEDDSVCFIGTMGITSKK